jgi:hypothetical protein
MEENLPECAGDYDKRIIMRKLYSGEITEEKLQIYLAELPDVSSCAEEVLVE